MGAKLKQQVGRQIAMAREALGLTQEQLSEAIGRSVEALSRIERGRTFPSPETFTRLAESLAVPVRDFFPHEGETGGVRDGFEARLLAASRALDPELLEIEVEHIEALCRHVTL